MFSIFPLTQGADMPDPELHISVRAAQASLARDVAAELLRFTTSAQNLTEDERNSLQTALQRDTLFAIAAYTDWFAGRVARRLQRSRRIPLLKMSDEALLGFVARHPDVNPDFVELVRTFLARATYIPVLGYMKKGFLHLDHAAIAAWTADFDFRSRSHSSSA